MRYLRTLTLASVTALAVLGSSTLAAPAVRAAGSPPGSVPVALFPSDAQGNRLPGPGWWTETAAAGTTLDLYAAVGNPGTKKVAFQLAPTDTATSTFGGIAYSLANQPLRATGKWVRLPGTRYSIKPDKALIIPFTVHVPGNIGAGQYVTGLAASPPPSARSPGAVGVKVQVRVAIPVIIIVPGPMHSRFTLRGVSVASVGTSTAVVLDLFNAGNTLLKGKGHLWVWRRGLSAALVSAPLSINTTLPQLPVPCPVILGPHPVATSYTWKLRLAWKGGSLTRHGAFRIQPVR
jgi:hypothetical protein